MDQLSQNFHLQRCEPGIAHGALDAEPAFGERGRLPVSSEFRADGEVSSPGIAWEDYSRCHIETRKIAPGRKPGCPSWAVNSRELRELVTRFFEARAGIRKRGDGSLVQRLNAAQQKILASVPRKVEVLDRLCREYIVVKAVDSARARVLTTQILNLDAVIRTAREGPGIIARLVYLYYAVGMDSAGVGSELGVSPRSIRQTVYRLHRLAKRVSAPEATRGKRARRSQ